MLEGIRQVIIIGSLFISLQKITKMLICVQIFNLSFPMEVFFPLFLSIFIFFLGVHAQQPYVAKQTTLCNLTDNASSAFGYSCNGVSTTCQSYLTFRSTPPYTSVSSISTLLASDPSELANLNSVSVNSTFKANTLVLIPVTCSCSGQYYQVNTTYTVNEGNTGFFPIANNTFQGLSVCDAIGAQNPGFSSGTLSAGNRVRVPLRCACPTKNQIDSGTKYLLSYLVESGDFIFRIRSMFGLSTDDSVFQANQLSSTDIYPFTTLLLPLQDPPTVSQTISPPPPPATPPPPFTGISTTNGSSNNNHTWVYAVVGSVGGVLLLVILVLIWFFLFRNKTKTEKMNDPVPVSSSESFEAVEKSDSVLLKDISVISKSLKVYSFKELEIATSNFSPSCLIKGSVYRGRINGDLAAIKRMDGDVSKEIELMNKISHFNLLRLSGVCFNGENWYLVHEYATRGSLSDWIFITDGAAEENFLSWTQRIQVAFDVATGLNYIHNYTSPPCIHGDVKTSNILLDGEFRGKIANFTLARSVVGEDGPFALTKHIVGTQGYMAPEYLENGLISTKIDVYAFGILLTEILTGNDAAGLLRGVKADLSDVLDSVVDDGGNGLKAFMDPRLEGKYPEDLAVFVLRTANGCVKREPSRRPGMDEVLQSLSRIQTASLAWEASRS